MSEQSEEQSFRRLHQTEEELSLPKKEFEHIPTNQAAAQSQDPEIDMSKQQDLTQIEGKPSRLVDESSKQNEGAEGCDDGDDCGGCKHKKGAEKQHSHRHGGRQPKNYCIMAYTIFTCLSCWYLETQHFNPLHGDYMADILMYLCYFDVCMCLWSYYQTYDIKNTVKFHKRLPNIEKVESKIIDPNYDLTARFCKQCNFYKLPRVSHCSSCGQCIYKLDHHCMWTQTCIGYCNQRPFLLFCIYMSIGVVQFWVTTVRTYRYIGGIVASSGTACGMIGASAASSEESTLSFFSIFEPGVYVLWAMTCFSAGVVGMMIIGLALSHPLMVLTNYTTLDNMKKKKVCPIPFVEWRKAYSEDKYINTFDRGEIANVKSLFGSNILTFWMPLGRAIENDFIIEPMNPLPSKLQLMRYTNLFEEEQKIQRDLEMVMKNIKEIYKGQEMILDGEKIKV